ncbi:MAG: glycine zipper 2TM domain-containing protein [Xanthomonadaceae bacterium]|nr:glycine zipper 2TM domain-containing protein [Xanthomonadaceae bacterium]
MKRFIISLLTLGLATASVTAFAQSTYGGYGSSNDNAYRTANDGYDGGYYDYARVVRVDPVLDDGYRTTSNAGVRCHDRTTAGYYENDGSDRGNYRYNNGYGYGYGNGYNGGNGAYRSEASRNVATIAGGIVGAVLGSKVGGGSGTYAATAVGSMLGGMAGREIYDQSQRNRYVRGGTVRVCDPVPVRDGYSSNYPNSYSGGDYGSASAYDVTYEYNGRRYTRRMSYNPGDRLRVRVDVTPQ